MSEHGKGYVRGTGPTPTTPPPPKPKPGDPHPAPAAGILNDMTDTVPVPRGLIEQAILALDHNGAVEAANALNTLLAPPQPTLRDALTAAYCGRGLGDKCPNYASHLYIVDRVLPVVEAAVSAAADEAWNAALDAATAKWNDIGPLNSADLRRLRRPTEGSAPSRDNTELRPCCARFVTNIHAMSPTVCSTCGSRLIVRDRKWIATEGSAPGIGILYQESHSGNFGVMDDPYKRGEGSAT